MEISIDNQNSTALFGFIYYRLANVAVVRFECFKRYSKIPFKGLANQEVQLSGSENNGWIPLFSYYHLYNVVTETPYSILEVFEDSFHRIS
jgi:hypothetical protein